MEEVTQDVDLKIDKKILKQHAQNKEEEENQLYFAKLDAIDNI